MVGTEQPMRSLRCSTILKLVVLVKVAVFRKTMLTMSSCGKDRLKPKPCMCHVM